jgi:hypothetical protein
MIRLPVPPDSIGRRPPAPGRLLDLDDDLFDAYFDRYPFRIRHDLSGHALLQLPRLVELAASLSAPILYFNGDHAVNQVDPNTTRAGLKRTFLSRQLSRPMLSAIDTLEQIESCNAWMQLRDVGAQPLYGALLDELIAEFRGPSERTAPGLSSPRMDIFVSSPGATTPYHRDEEHNFLLQIRGRKHLSVADGFESPASRHEQLRAYFSGNGELAPYSSAMDELAVHVAVSPGDGVHIPPCHAHWVQNGQEVSISVGILWYSDVTARRRYLYRMNEWLRQAGLDAAPPGTHPFTDAIKTLPLSIKRQVIRWRRLRSHRRPSNPRTAGASAVGSPRNPLEP